MRILAGAEASLVVRNEAARGQHGYRAGKGKRGRRRRFTCSRSSQCFEGNPAARRPPRSLSRPGHRATANSPIEWGRSKRAQVKPRFNSHATVAEQTGMCEEKGMTRGKGKGGECDAGRVRKKREAVDEERSGELVSTGVGEAYIAAQCTKIADYGRSGAILE